MDSVHIPATQHQFEEIAAYYKINSSLDLFYDIAVRKIDISEVKDWTYNGDKIVFPKLEKAGAEDKADTHKPSARKEAELVIFGESSDKIMYSLANCCKPIPGDDVFGFITQGEGLKIHRTNCPNAARLLANYGHRVVKTKWMKNKEISFLTGIKIVGLDDVGVINKITNLISGTLKININALTIEAKEGVFEGNLKVYVHDKDELENLVNKLIELPGIETVERFDSETSV